MEPLVPLHHPGPGEHQVSPGSDLRVVWRHRQVPFTPHVQDILNPPSTWSRSYVRSGSLRARRKTSPRSDGE